MSPPSEKAALTDEEAGRVVELIRPWFDKYLSEYEERKYPSGVYENLLRAFGAPDKVADGDIRTAMLWKFGHLAKDRIPSRHEALISCVQERWPDLSSATLGSPREVFDRLIAALGGAHRYVTVSFLLHLLRPADVPIIDQHNFRAMNYYVGSVRPGWRSKSRPSSYDDLERLSNFLNAIRRRWKNIESSTVPSQRNLDRFLMMYGRALKSQKVTSYMVRSDPVVPTFEPSRGPGDSDLDCSIRLPFGGAGATFDVSTLIQHLKQSGRPYIIQGQTQCSFSQHPKPRSLDVWLRRNFAKNPDTKQAVNDVIRQLVSTGLFDAGEFLCPDSGHLCKGIRIAQA